MFDMSKITVVPAESKIEHGQQTATIVLEYPTDDINIASEVLSRSSAVGAAVANYTAKHGVVGRPTINPVYGVRGIYGVNRFGEDVQRVRTDKNAGKDVADERLAIVAFRTQVVINL